MKIKNEHSLDYPSKNECYLDNLSYIREETRTALTRKARTWHKRKRENVVMSTLRRKKT